MNARTDGNPLEPLALVAGQVPVTDEDLARAARELVVVLQAMVSRLPVADLRPRRTLGRSGSASSHDLAHKN